jgi:hypothetical protein
MPKSKVFIPSDTDIDNMLTCVKFYKKALSVEKCPDGFYVVMYNVDSELVAEHTTKKGWNDRVFYDFIYKYLRIDKNKKDTPSNRIVFTSQSEAEKEVFRYYELIKNKTN